MPIISVSLNDKLHSEVNALMGKKGFSGKSEFFRAAARDFINNHYASVLSAEKNYSASLSVVIPETKRGELHRIHDRFNSVVRSQFHLCLSEERCMEVFGLTGTGKQIKDLIALIEAMPKVEKVNLSVDN